MKLDTNDNIFKILSHIFFFIPEMFKIHNFCTLIKHVYAVFKPLKKTSVHRL